MCSAVQYGCGAASMAYAQANFAEGVLSQDRLGTVFGTETFFADPAEVADVFQKCTVDSEYQHERWGEFALRQWTLVDPAIRFAKVKRRGCCR